MNELFTARSKTHRCNSSRMSETRPIIYAQCQFLVHRLRAADCRNRRARFLFFSARQRKALQRCVKPFVTYNAYIADGGRRGDIYTFIYTYAMSRTRTSHKRNKKSRTFGRVKSAQTEKEKKKKRNTCFDTQQAQSSAESTSNRRTCIGVLDPRIRSRGGGLVKGSAHVGFGLFRLVGPVLSPPCTHTVCGRCCGDRAVSAFFRPFLRCRGALDKRRVCTRSTRSKKRRLPNGVVTWAVAIVNRAKSAPFLQSPTGCRSVPLILLSEATRRGELPFHRSAL